MKKYSIQLIISSNNRCNCNCNNFSFYIFIYNLKISYYVFKNSYICLFFFFFLYIYHYIAIKELMNERMKKKPNLCISSGRSKSNIKVENYFISFRSIRKNPNLCREWETKAKKHNFYLSYLFRVSLKLINKIIERKKKRGVLNFNNKHHHTKCITIRFNY